MQKLPNNISASQHDPELPSSPRWYPHPEAPGCPQALVQLPVLGRGAGEPSLPTQSFATQQQTAAPSPKHSTCQMLHALCVSSTSPKELPPGGDQLARSPALCNAFPFYSFPPLLQW